MWVDQLNRVFDDRYRVQRELGHNGFRVYLALDLKHDRKVALWVTRPEGPASIHGEQFLREVSLAAQLDHPHILPVVECGQAGEFVYCVTVHPKGESLRDRLHRETQMRVDDALEITCQVAGALSYAHSHGVVHHDVKPEKIQIEAGHALLGGWIDRALMVTSIESMPGVVIGTLFYMSPEQAAGARDVDHRSDVYSLACVLYEMLIGDPPLVASDPRTLLAKLSAEIPTPIRRLRRKVPPAVEAALATALAKRPSDRFPTVLQFAAALDPHQIGTEKGV